MGCFNSTPTTQDPPPEHETKSFPDPGGGVEEPRQAEESASNAILTDTSEQQKQALQITVEDAESNKPAQSIRSPISCTIVQAKSSHIGIGSPGLASPSFAQSPQERAEDKPKSAPISFRNHRSDTYEDTDLDEGVVPLEEDEDTDYLGVLQTHVPGKPLHRRGTAPSTEQSEGPGDVHKWDSSAVANLMHNFKRPGSIFNSKKTKLIDPENDSGSHFKVVDLHPDLIATGKTIRTDLGNGPSQILKKLFLGTEADADNPEALAKWGITHVLSLCKTSARPQYTEMHWIMNDHGKTTIKKKYKELMKFISAGQKKGKRILVHCKQGQNRSASIVVLWLMRNKNWSLKKAHDFVVEKRNVVMINKNYRSQLREFDFKQFKTHSTDAAFGTQTLFETGLESSEEETSDQEKGMIELPNVASEDRSEEIKSDGRMNTDRTRSFDHEKKDTQRSNLSVPDVNGSETKPSSAEPTPRPDDYHLSSQSRLDTTKSCPPQLMDNLSADEAKPNRSRIKTTPNAATENEFLGLLGALGASAIGRRSMIRQRTASPYSGNRGAKPALSRPKSLGMEPTESIEKTDKETLKKQWKM